MQVSAPNDVMGGVTRQITSRRGVIEDMPVEGSVTTVIGRVPVAETFGFSNDIRAASQGRHLEYRKCWFRSCSSKLFSRQWGRSVNVRD